MPRFCENCGTPLKEGAKFCTSCGQPVTQMAQPMNKNMNEPRTYAPQTPPVNPSPVAPPPYSQVPKKKDNTLLIVLIALAVVLVIIKIIQTSRATRQYRYYYGQMMSQTNPSQTDSKTFFYS